MPRAHRNHLPGHVWHITHRCYRKQFLLKFARDRQTWISWLYEARRRYGLCVLDYTVTCNHAHLLVHDQGAGVRSPQASSSSPFTHSRCWMQGAAESA